MIKKNQDRLKELIDTIKQYKDSSEGYIDSLELKVNKIYKTVSKYIDEDFIYLFADESFQISVEWFFEGKSFSVYVDAAKIDFTIFNEDTGEDVEDHDDINIYSSEFTDYLDKYCRTVKKDLEISDLIMAINQCLEDMSDTSLRLQKVSDQLPKTSFENKLFADLQAHDSSMFEKYKKQIQDVMEPFIRQEESKTKSIFEQKNKDVK